MRSRGTGVVLALAAVVPAWAAVTNVRVLGTTATQAVIAYTAPGMAACSVEVSDSVSYAPVVWDVDGGKFAGAPLDSRTGNVVRGRDRIFVAGKRAAEKAADGRFYSRALQAFTLHYFRITCGSDTATGTFRTTNIPLGVSYPEPYPVDPANPGQYGWPNQHLDQQQESFVDPSTGALIHRMTGAASFLGSTIGPYANSGAYDDSPVSPRWSITLAGNALSSASYTGDGTSTPKKMFVPLDQAAGYPSILKATYEYEQTHLTALRVKVTGSGSGATTADKSVTMCISVDGVSCVSGGAQPTLDLSGCGTGCYVGNTTDSTLNFWFGGAIPTFNHVDAGLRTTTASYDDTTGAATYKSGHYFSPRWTTGTRVLVGGTSYKLNPFTDIQHASLPAGLGAGDKTINSQNFGVLIWKNTNAAGSVATVTNVEYSFSYSYAMGFLDQAAAEHCHPQLLERASSGRRGYHCTLIGISGLAWLAWIDQDSADTRLLGSMTIPAKSDAGGNGWSATSYFQRATFDRDDPNSLYQILTDQNGKHVLVKATYAGDNSGMPGNQIPYGSATAPWDAAHLTNLTPYNPSGPHYDLDTLIGRFDSAYNPSDYSAWAINHITPSGKIVLTVSRAQDYTPGGWFVVLDPSIVPDATNNPVIAAVPTADRSGTRPNLLRWGVYHSMSGSSEGWVTLGVNCVGYRCYGGPDTDGLFKTTLAQAIPDATATTIYTAGEPGNGVWDIARVGDTINIDNEYLKIAAKTSVNEWVVQRGYNGTTAAAHPAGANVLMLAGNMGEYSATTTLWNWAADPHGLNSGGATVRVDAPYFTGGHGTFKGGKATLVLGGGTCGTTMGDGSYYCAATKTAEFPAAFGLPATSFQSIYLPFAGKRSQLLGYESHMSRAQWLAAPAWEQDWVIDSHPLYNGTGFGPTFAAIGGTTQLYKGTATWNRKHVPVFAMCGARPLKDVSGPGSIIQDGAAGAHTYCIPSAAGECRSGSSVSEVYINCPNLTGTSCRTHYVASPSQTAEDPCVYEAVHIAGVPVVQRSTAETDRSGNLSTRILARAPERWRRQWLDYTSNGKALPGGEWVLYLARWADDQRSDYYAVKVPPFPDRDSLNRATFTAVTAQVNSAPAGTDNAIAEFGYDPNFYCTSRLEACVANGTGQVSQTTPFWWASESFSGLSCAAGCTLTIPALPQRVVYYRLKYRNAGGAVLMIGPTRVTVTP